MYYRLRLVSPLLGMDESGPLQSSLDRAREVAMNMIDLYQGKIRVEIRRVVDVRLRKTEWVETIEPYGFTMGE